MYRLDAAKEDYRQKYDTASKELVDLKSKVTTNVTYSGTMKRKIPIH